MSAVSDNTIKSLLWIEDKWTDFWYTIEKPFSVVLCVWFALFAVFALIKGAFWVLNVDDNPVFMNTGAILFGVPVLLLIAFILLGIALFIASTPLVVAGRTMWLAKNAKAVKNPSEDAGILFAKISIIMSSIFGAIVGVYNLTRNTVGVEGLLTFTGIGLAVGIGIGAWGMFLAAIAVRVDEFDTTGQLSS
jgi:hypothetical protein